VVVGFIALLILGYFRDVGFKLSGNRRREVLMKKVQKTLRVLVFDVVNVCWAIGASATAVPLSA